MTLQTHPLGNYAFVPGIAPYSCGVISDPGFEIVHVTLRSMLPWQAGFQKVADYLAAVNRPATALCAMSLRSPAPFSFAGFASFNAEYAAVLQDWGVFVDGVNPIARTNVAPELVPPAEPSLYGFAYTRPCAASQRPTFVVAGAGELPEGVLNREGIVRLDDVSPAGIAAKAEFVIDLMQNRLQLLQTDWSAVTQTNVYTIHPVSQVITELLNPRIGDAGIHGATWHFTRPPIHDIEYEMDVRGVVTEIVLE